MPLLLFSLRLLLNIAFFIFSWLFIINISAITAITIIILLLRWLPLPWYRYIGQTHYTFAYYSATYYAAAGYCLYAAATYYWYYYIIFQLLIFLHCHAIGFRYWWCYSLLSPRHVTIILLFCHEILLAFRCCWWLRQILCHWRAASSRPLFFFATDYYIESHWLIDVAISHFTFRHYDITVIVIDWPLLIIVSHFFFTHYASQASILYTLHYVISSLLSFRLPHALTIIIIFAAIDYYYYAIALGYCRLYYAGHWLMAIARLADVYTLH